MPDLNKVFNKAKSSAMSLRLLNFGLNRTVPFNKPHGFRVTRISDDSVETRIPYKRRNMNHIKGIHACALATLSEFTTGVFLISKFSPDKYRIILRSLAIEYHYQGKSEIHATYGLSEVEVQEKILGPLESRDSVDIECEVKTFDQKENHISTGRVTWQIKPWDKVKTKV